MKNKELNQRAKNLLPLLSQVEQFYKESNSIWENVQRSTQAKLEAETDYNYSDDYNGEKLTDVAWEVFADENPDVVNLMHRAWELVEKYSPGGF